MKTGVLLALLLWQGQVLPGSGPETDASHMRFQRVIAVPAAAPTCTVLDGRVFAGAASRSLEDLRLFTPDGRELPFALTESSSLAEPTAEAALRNVKSGASELSFDLEMPPGRVYSELDLRLAAKDFLASAEVTDAASGIALGTFTIFDLSSEHLGRSTVLALQEATAPVLHLRIRFRSPSGAPLHVPASALRSVEVPPSREAQTLYTTVLSAPPATQGEQSVASFDVPAHVPVERVAVALPPSFSSNFMRTIAVRSFLPGQRVPVEEVTGQIDRVHIDPPSQLRTPALRDQHMAMNAVLSSNLHERTRVEVRIENGREAPLPLRAVELQMRQRRICFAPPQPGSYTLRYGDPGLRAPVSAASFLPNQSFQTADLGDEQPNPAYTPRNEVRPYTVRHPELLWIALFSLVALLGAIAIGSARHQRRIQ